MNDKDILLAALERASAAESMLRRLVDETENDGVVGWEERITQCIADANNLLSGKFIDGSGACNTCNGHGMVGGHSGQTPEQYEEWQEECPDCTPLTDARRTGEYWKAEHLAGNEALQSANARLADVLALADRWVIQNCAAGQGPAGNKARRQCAAELRRAAAGEGDGND